MYSQISSTQWEQFRNIPNTLKGKVIVEFLYSTGCRVNELCNVKVGDIDLPNREVKVLGKGNKERMVYLNDKIYLLLKEYLADKSPEDYLLNAPNDPSTRISNNAIRKRFDKWCEQCPDIPFGVTPHIIRHTMATTLLDRGVPIEQISALLGHSQLETTMVYINLNTNQIKESHRKYII